MKNIFKDAMQKHINKIELSSNQLQKLQALQKNNVKTNHKNRIPLFVMVASISLVLIITLLTTQINPLQNRLVAQIADEVAKNHLKLKPLEIRSEQITDVQNYFDKLDFLPISSLQFKQRNQVSLAGGRYCSIKGSTAAQLRYQQKDGKFVTLFQTNYSDMFWGLPDIEKDPNPITTYARGVEITIWIEKGLVMVTAKSND
ncbi:MAG: hypothetical protein JKY19_12000 [Alcanivoracaceae bacterium]|nr:hypothetical protein [Alcanivoracaceae bacterium]